jgi:lipopolysaccharide transport system ATP-binding protein
LSTSTEISCISLADRKDRNGNGNVRFISVLLQDEQGRNVTSLYSGEAAKIIFFFENNTKVNLKNVHFSIGLDSNNGQRIAYFSNEIIKEKFSIISIESQSIELYIPKLPLMPGRYGFTIYCSINNVVVDWIKNAGFFDVEPGDYYGTGKLPPNNQGDFLIDYNLKIL